MKVDKVHIEMDDGFQISAALYEASEAKGLLQIIHGAVEYKGRYEEFAGFLQEHGYTVLVSDNRGHGESVADKYPLGYMDNVDRMVEDQVQIMKWFKKRYPGKSLNVFGHSLGSIFARCMLWENDDEISKLILSGTVPYNVAAPLGVWLGNFIVKVEGKTACNKLLQTLSGLSADNTWIVHNPESMEAYRADPLCGYEYPNISTLTVIKADRILHKWKAYKVRNPKLPIMSVTGIDDKISGGPKGLKRTQNDLRKLGYGEMINKVYENMGHEVLNEIEREKVYKDVLEFLDEIVKPI